MPYRLITTACCILLLCASCGPANHPPMHKPPLADAYLDLITSYAVYAKTIWHDGDVGGYWGAGLGEANKNGAVRGTTGTMLGYAMLVHAMDNHWLNPELLARLNAGGLDRRALLGYIHADLAHITAHHLSAPKPLEPTWGFSWQSAFWTGNAGPAVLLVINDLPPELLRDFKRVVFSEADRIASKPPKDYKPGDTGAEENGWDTSGPAMALALEPRDPRAIAWFDALKRYAVNTYSVRADRTSDARIGADRLRDLVTTANLFDDFTLENHGFFHPDYVQVSGQELGDSLLFLELGDQIHGTHWAERFRPYAMHHVEDVWEAAARPLVLPTGEFAFPNGSDWQLNCSMMPAYFAFIAATFHDPVAFAAAERHPVQAMHRRALSDNGRIFGDTNMEWFWEPILARRSSIALLQLAGNPPPQSVRSGTPLREMIEQRYFPHVKVWMYRNREYFVSAAWGGKHMGTFYPLGNRDENPYLTVPIEGILPGSVDTFERQQRASQQEPQALVLRLKDRRLCALICLPYSVLWISPLPLRPLGIQNDKLSGGKRTLFSQGGSQIIVALTENKPLELRGWVNIDNSLGLVSAGKGFRYTPTRTFNRRSLAYDQIVPVADVGAWQMVPNVTADETRALAAVFNADFSSDAAKITVQDGARGRRYHIRMTLLAAGPEAVIIEPAN